MHVPRTTLLPLLFLILAAIAPLNATAAFKNTLYYPYVEMSVPGGIDITFLFNGRRSKTSCETLAANVTNSMLAVCPTCQTKAKQCLDSLEPQHRKLLSAWPLDIPSARLCGAGVGGVGGGAEGVNPDARKIAARYGISRGA